MPDDLSLLLIEDSPSDALLITQGLAESLGPNARTVHVASLRAGLDRLGLGGFDAVILDLDLPDSSGLATFTRVTAADPLLPVIVMTGLDDSALGEEAVRLGAQDYLLKDNASGARVGRSVIYAIRRQRILAELERAKRDELAAKDRFLSHVSHELRAPLAALHQFVSLVADGAAGPLTTEQRDYLEVATRNIDHLRTMVDDLLDATRGVERLPSESFSSTWAAWSLRP